MRIIITGGAGFIGTSLIRLLIKDASNIVLNFDKLSYAGVKESSESIDDPRYKFVQGDICDLQMVQNTINSFKPDIVMNLAAESHVDRSIDNPFDFVKTNVNGTVTLLHVIQQYYNNLSRAKKAVFKFLHISTDEVFGSLDSDGLFNEDSRYDPSSPYSASKASSDHFVRAWNRTYNLPTIISNCSNNYGPYQFPEKLIPLTILNAINSRKIPIYGKGTQIRDWLYVVDHARALQAIALNGKIGETYNIGGSCEMTNLDVVKKICEILDQKQLTKKHDSYAELIEHVSDRPGHDERYAIDNSKISNELSWSTRETFESGIEKTIDWYINNKTWVEIVSRRYKFQRIGTLK